MKEIPITSDKVPNDWITSDTSDFALKNFRAFLGIGHIDLPMMKRLSVLVKKGVDNFLEPIIKKGHYANIESFTAQELETLPNLSDKKYNRFTNFFKLDKMNKIQLNGKDVSLFVLKKFTHVNLIEVIPPIVISNMSDGESVIFTCTTCHGEGGKMITMEIPIQRQHYSGVNNGEMAGGWEPSKSYKEVWKKCSACDGKGSLGFYFETFRKIVEKYNKTIDKINREIDELNKNVHLVDEYNHKVDNLNQKIRIWNSKCPRDAIDNSHESDEDYVKYFLQEKQVIEKNHFGTNSFSESYIITPPTPTEKEKIESHLQYLKNNSSISGMSGLANEIFINITKLEFQNQQEIEHVSRQINTFAENFYSIPKKLSNDDFRRVMEIIQIMREEFKIKQNELKEISQTSEKYKNNDEDNFRKSAI